MISFRSFARLSFFFFFVLSFSVSHSASRDEFDGFDGDDEREFFSRQSSYSIKRSKNWSLSAPASRRPSLQEYGSRRSSIEAPRADPYAMAQILIDKSSFKTLEETGALTQTVLLLQQSIKKDADVGTLLNLGADYFLQFQSPSLSAKTVCSVLLTFGKIEDHYPRDIQPLSSVFAYQAMINHYVSHQDGLSTLENQFAYLWQAAKVFNQTFGAEELSKEILRSSLEWTQSTPEESVKATDLITQMAFNHPHTWQSMISKGLHATFDYTLEEATNYLQRMVVHVRGEAPFSPSVASSTYEATPTKRLPSSRPAYHRSLHKKNLPTSCQKTSSPSNKQYDPSSPSSPDPTRRKTRRSSDVFSDDDD